MDFMNASHHRPLKTGAVGFGVALSLFAAGYAAAPLFTPEHPAGASSKQTASHLRAAAPGIRVAAAGDRVSVLAPLPDERLAAPAADTPDASPDMRPVETYYSVLQRLEESFYQKPASGRELTYAAIRGMLGSLGDRYTRFLDPGEYRRMQQENEGEFGGIGAKLDKVQGKTVIKEVVEGTPAQRGGVVAGDAVLEVDGKSVAGISIFKVVDMIRGQKGVAVRLTLERKGVAKPFVKSIVRDTIKLPTVTAEIVKDANKKPTGIARIELTQFNQLAHSELDQALDRMMKQGMKGLILDLRNNPGGLLSEAIQVGSRFVDSGPIVIIQERGGKLRQQAVERVPRRYRGPLVVLVNKFSASASEIVAGAIKDTNTGVLVGTDTWGKGLVQTITPIRDDGSAVLITTHKYLTPNGTDINKKGIAPHYKVEIKKEDVGKRDPQLEKAVAILKGEVSPKAVATQPAKPSTRQ